MPTDSPKPTKPYHHRLNTTDGNSIEAYSDAHVVGSWLQFPGDDRSLSVQSVNYHGNVQNYIGYRDGIAKVADRVALSIMADGSVLIQVVLPGNIVRTISLDQLDELVRNLPPDSA